MKVMFINTFCGRGSTGRICTDMLKLVKQKGGEGLIAYGIAPGLRAEKDEMYLTGGRADYYFHNIMSRLLDREGCFSRLNTRRLIRRIREYRPDVVHLHNLHGHYINYKLLFSCLASMDVKVIWTLHDSWSFTGHCCYFSWAGCQGWRQGCVSCPCRSAYPKSWFISRSEKNLREKQQAVCALKDLTVVTPSRWLKELAEQSYLGKYPVQVINNGIDLKVFRPCAGDFREKYGLKDKKIILGVAGEWEERKGIKDIYSLAGSLGGDYAIVLVGLEEAQAASMEENIPGMILEPDGDGRVFSYRRQDNTAGAGRLLCITKTDSPEALAELYSAADVFVNPTYEDNFPTVNIEALACGTPVVTYDTGGSPEALDESCGVVCPQGDIEALISGIERALGLSRQAALSRAQRYCASERYGDYYRLYLSGQGGECGK